MKTRMEQEALDKRKENPETLEMLINLHRETKKKLRLTYPDGHHKIIDGTGINLQKLMRHCESQGIDAELIQEERS